MSATVDKVMPDLANRRFRLRYTTALNMLMKKGVDINRVDILACGEHENYKGEIREQEPAPGTALERNTRFSLSVGRSSAVDYTPYQLFYGLRGYRSSSGNWEDEARALMAPFDAAVIRREAITAYEDRKNSFSYVEYDQLRKFLQLFNFTVESDSHGLQEVLVWVSAFPSFQKWAGNATLVCRVLRGLFGNEFEIRENIRWQHDIPGACRYHLGSEADRLGHGSFVGRSFVDCDSGYEVVVRGVSVADVSHWLQGGKKRKKLEAALRICMPSNLMYRIRVITRREKVPVGKEGKKNYLGYSSRVHGRGRE
ncbi:MAG: type VI secretion system baseplate subunit TssG [candidate division Zixibacteria bacterium]|nr:type VI secretion system baseplate subunit TssG [candidate division Zixibacteria bacterium]